MDSVDFKEIIATNQLKYLIGVVDILKQKCAMLETELKTLNKELEMYQTQLSRIGFKPTIDNANDIVLDKRFDDRELYYRTDLKLSTRTLNCLKIADITTVRELVKTDKKELLKFRGFGKTSLFELEDFLESLGLSFGMCV